MTSPSFVIKDAPPAVTDWPPEPYKGLNYYEAEDVRLLAGRSNDLSICVRLLGAPGTRLFVLHGSTGCGKSSFLRAGLVPFLERSENGFLFIRDGARDVPIFVHCTDDPFSRLAEAIHDVSQQTRTLTNEAEPEKPRVIYFSEVLAVDPDLSTFIKRTAPEQLVDLLAQLASALPETLVLVIDQVEELFTLKPGRRGERERQRCFDFTHAYLRAEMDLKIILALRTEYFGRLLARLRRTPFDATRISDYLLTDLNEQQLIEAIMRPAPTKRVDGFSDPPYEFRYEPRLARRIARDLGKAVPTGGVLPVMQLVCSRIYKTARERQDPGMITIRRSDYEGVERPVEAYLKDSLRELCSERHIPVERIEAEMEKWRFVLLKLTKTQADGTVTTELVRAEKLVDDVSDARCTIPLDEQTVSFLDARRIIRPVGVYNAARNRLIDCFVLGHDVIGLALKNWEVPLPKLRLQDAQRMSWSFGIMSAAFLGIYFLFTLVTGRRFDFADPVYFFALFYGVIGFIGSTRWGIKAAAKLSATFFAALAGAMSSLGRRKNAARYQRVADVLQAAARDGEADANSPAI